MYRHIKAEIDLNALEYNINQILKLVPSDRVMGVVKANAYGHGAAEVVKTLTHLGINRFAVSNVHEALDLRSTNSDCDILILGYSDLSAVAELATLLDN